MSTLTTFWLRQHLKQGRILIVYLLTLVLLVLNSYVYSVRYQTDIENQNAVNRLFEENIATIVSADDLSATTITTILPASSRRFIADNNLDDLPITRPVDPLTVQLPQSAGGRRVEFNNLWDIDLTFLVGVIFSFLAVVMTFDSVCGEKKDGTMRLLLSNSTPRYKIVLSKITASVLTIGIPLIVGLVINNLILSFTRVVSFDIEMATSMLLFALVSLVFLFFYCSLGVLISSLNREPITSLVILLLIWVLLVVLVPGVAKPVAREVVTVKNQEELSQAVNEHWRVFFRRYHEVGAWDRPAEIAREDGFTKEYKWGEIRTVLLNSIQGTIDEHLRDMYNQAELARSIARVSPNMVYKFIVSRVAGTSYVDLKDFYSQVVRYKQVLFNFLKNQDALDPDSPHIHGSQGRGYLSTKPLTAEIPRFTYVPSSLSERLEGIMVDALILFTLAACAMLFCVYLFNRYDVR